jgi:hypothetical protein
MLSPEKLVAFFIGTNGKAIKKLMFDANTEITVLTDKIESKFRCVRITGFYPYLGKIKNVLKTFSIIYRVFNEKNFFIDEKSNDNNN